MPLYWIIDSRTELISAVAEGDVSIGDAMTFLRALSGAKVIGYRKLFESPTRARNWLDAQVGA